DVQPPRDLRHLTAVMADRESDGLGFDVGKRAHMTAVVEQCQGGLVAEAAHVLVEEAALHRIVVDDQTAFAHAATTQAERVPNWGTVADQAYRGVKSAALASTSTRLILLAISSIARRPLRRFREPPVDPRRSRAISIHARRHGRF